MDNINNLDNAILEVIKYFTHMNDDECICFTNKEKYSILERIMEKEWFINKYGKDFSSMRDEEGEQRIKNLAELFYFDIAINDKVYLFLSELGMSTWHVCIILSTFIVAHEIFKTENIKYELLLSLLIESETQIIANFLAMFGGEQFGQSIKLPNNFFFRTTNERIKEKIIIGGEYTDSDKKVVESIYKILKNVIFLSGKTNEGKPIKFNCLYYQDKIDNENTICNILDLYNNYHFPTNFCQNESTAFLVNANGNIFKYLTLEGLEQKYSFDNIRSICSFKHKNIADRINNDPASNNGESIIGISLESDGSIYILMLSGLLCYYKNSEWHFNFTEYLRKILFIFEADAVIESIYDTMIFHHGCCLGLLPEGNNLFTVPEEDDFFKKMGIIDETFSVISSEIRMELMSIDGAVLLESDSLAVKGVARILPVDSSKNEGARTGAAKYIAKNKGIGIKISEDGYIDIYKNINNQITHVKSLGKGIKNRY
jgi:hypothetical protein